MALRAPAPIAPSLDPEHADPERLRVRVITLTLTLTLTLTKALTVLTWLSSRIADLATEGVLTQHELQEGLRRVDEMVGAFNGTAQTSTP